MKGQIKRALGQLLKCNILWLRSHYFMLRFNLSGQKGKGPHDCWGGYKMHDRAIC